MLLRTYIILASALVSSALTIPQVSVAQEHSSENFWSIDAGATAVPTVPSTPQTLPCYAFARHIDPPPGVTLAVQAGRRFRPHWSWEFQAGVTEIPHGGDTYQPQCFDPKCCPATPRGFLYDGSRVLSLSFVPKFYIRPDHVGFFLEPITGARWFVIDPEHPNGLMYPALGLGGGFLIERRVVIEGHFERIPWNQRTRWMVPVTMGWEW